MSKWVSLALLAMYTCTAGVLLLAAYLAESDQLAWGALAVYTWAVAQFTWRMKDE